MVDRKYGVTQLWVHWRATVNMVIGLCNKQRCLLGDHVLLRDFGPYVIVFMNARLLLTVAMVMLLKEGGLLRNLH